MNSSFYGGKQGASFILAKSFSSIAEMIAAFKLGENYHDVHFDEYVIINTVNKNDPDNGKMYRRGYALENGLAGAIYVGQVVGPAGAAPLLSFTTLDDVRIKSEGENASNYQEGEYAPLTNLIPGKQADGTFNDSIKWASCSIRDDQMEDTIAYIGFKIPYPVIEISAEGENAYYDKDLLDVLDDGSHPFYHKWRIHIPKGVQGDSIKNLRVMIADSSIEDYPNKVEDIANGEKVLVYDQYNYDILINGLPKTIYLGKANSAISTEGFYDSIIGGLTDSDINNKQEQLKDNGIWFVLS